MATIKSVERQILRREGFRVRMLHEDGRDIRSDKARVPGYPYALGLKSSASVRTWIDKRFKVTYPGYRVEVLYASGRKAHGGTKLATVRDSYLED